MRPPASGKAAISTAKAMRAAWASPGIASLSDTQNGAGVRHAINIFKIQPNPEKQPPVQVGEIPAWVEGNQGFDDRELRSLVYKTSKGEDRYILVRNGGTNTAGRMETYRIDMNTCLPMAKSEVYDFHSQSHEFFLWHDPVNPNRVLALHDDLDLRACPIPIIPA